MEWIAGLWTVLPWTGKAAMVLGTIALALLGIGLVVGMVSDGECFAEERKKRPLQLAVRSRRVRKRLTGRNAA